MTYDNFLNIIAQAAPAAPNAGQQGGSGFSPIVMMLCVGVIFYFMLIRPQNKRQKEQQALISSVKTGDKVIVAGGIHGLVANVKENTVLIKVADNVKIEVDKSSITTVTKRIESESKTESSTPAAS